MISIRIQNLRAFTKNLFTENIFDQFELSEAVFTTNGLFTIDGSVNKEYYDDQNPETLPRHVSWKQIRPIAFSIIKGNRLPVSFRISLCASPDMIADCLGAADNTYSDDPDLIDTLNLNIVYKNGFIDCTSATSLKSFTLDQSLSKIWDRYIIAFLDYHEIDYNQNI